MFEEEEVAEEVGSAIWIGASSLAALALAGAGREKFTRGRMNAGQPRLPNQSPEPTRVNARHADEALGPRGSS